MHFSSCLLSPIPEAARSHQLKLYKPLVKHLARQKFTIQNIYEWNKSPNVLYQLHHSLNGFNKRLGNYQKSIS